MGALWGGRFSGVVDPVMARFNASLPFDWTLWEADIVGSIAWAGALARAGLLTETERDQIVGGLEAIRAELAPDPSALLAAASDEDIHSYVERWLTERIGAVAGKLHTGRSRNDQVAVDVRLWLKWQIAGQGREAGDRGQSPAAGLPSPSASLQAGLAGLIRAAAASRGADLPTVAIADPAEAAAAFAHGLPVLGHADADYRPGEPDAAGARLALLATAVTMLVLKKPLPAIAAGILAAALVRQF